MHHFPLPSRLTRLLLIAGLCSTTSTVGAATPEGWVELKTLVGTASTDAAPEKAEATSASAAPPATGATDTTDTSAPGDAAAVSDADTASTVEPSEPNDPPPHGLIAVPMPERLQSLQSVDTEDEVILLESAAQVDPKDVINAVDEAFAHMRRPAETETSGAAAGQAAEAAGRVTAELINEPPPVDPLEVALFATPPEPADGIFMAARAAFQTGDLAALRENADLLVGHPLESYLELWTIELELKAAPDAATPNLRFQDFIERHQGEYVGERAAADYLRLSGPRINRTLFESVFSRLVWNKDDPDVAAWRTYYRLLETPADRQALQSAKALYRDGQATRAANQTLGDLIVRRDRSWAWDRVVLLLQKGEWDEVKRVLSYVPRPELPAPIDTLSAILDQPVAWYNRHADEIGRLPARLGVFATLRLARAQPALAAQCATSVERRLGAFWRSLLWSVIGYQGTTALNPEAVGWYAKAGNALAQRPLLVVNYRSVLGWNTRAALRAGNWFSLARLIERMPKSMQEEEVWTYWRARALRARGQETQARQLFERIDGNVSFYGKLACDALGKPYAFDKAKPKVADANPERWESETGLLRARTFYRLDLYREGHREWNWAMRGLKGADYVALAEYAKKKLLIHRMINTSERSGKDVVSIEQRYPMPHALLIERVSEAQQIPSAWVYGLIRQESRFIPSVSSSVGARGLMQVMPLTAQWIARKLGITHYDQGNLTELEMNLVLGSAYLRVLRAEFDSSYVLATAAYNAGPARARVWRRTLREPMEAAVFIETIPFYETRDYVKNVLSNMQTYSMRTAAPIENFTRFLGRVHPGTTPGSDLP